MQKRFYSKNEAENYENWMKSCGYNTDIITTKDNKGYSLYIVDCWDSFDSIEYRKH